MFFLHPNFKLAFLINELDVVNDDLTENEVTLQLVSFGQFFFFFYVFIYFERESTCMSEGRTETERERIPSKFHTVSAEPDTGPKPTGREIMA